MDKETLIILLLITLSVKTNARYDKVKVQDVTKDNNHTKAIHKRYDVEIHLNTDKIESQDKEFIDNNTEVQSINVKSGHFNSRDKDFSHSNAKKHSTDVKNENYKRHDHEFRNVKVNIKNSVMTTIFDADCRPGTERDNRGWCVEEKCQQGYVRFNGVCVAIDND